MDRSEVRRLRCAATVDTHPHRLVIPRELLPPERFRPSGILSLQPRDVIAKGARIRQVQPDSTPRRFVEREHFLQEQRQAPAVCEHVMMTPQKAAFTLAQSCDDKTHQRSIVKVEAPAAVIIQELSPARLLLFRGEIRPVLLDQRKIDVAMHDLQRTVQAVPFERGAQHGLPLDHAVPGRRERGQVELPFQHTVLLNDIDPGVGRQQRVEQQPLLRRRQWVDVDDVAIGHLLFLRLTCSSRESSRFWSRSASPKSDGVKPPDSGSRQWRMILSSDSM